MSDRATSHGWLKYTRSIYFYTVLATLFPVVAIGAVLLAVPTSLGSTLARLATDSSLCRDIQPMRGYIVALVSANDEKLNPDEVSRLVRQHSADARWAVDMAHFRISNLGFSESQLEQQRLSALSAGDGTTSIYLLSQPEGLYVACSRVFELSDPRFSSYKRAVYTVAWPSREYEDLKADFTDDLSGIYRLAIYIVFSTLIVVGGVHLAVQLIFIGGALSRLRQDVRSIQDGSSGRLNGNYPLEMLELKDLLNATMESNERALHSTRQLVSKIAHDLNNKLQALIGAVNADTIDRIAVRRAVAQMKNLIERYRQLQGAIGGPSSWRREQFDIIEFVNEVVEIQSFDLQNRKVRYEVIVPPGKNGRSINELIVAANKTDLEIILSNLLSNASKYGGGLVNICVASDEADVIIRVSDNGPGIPEDKAVAIFNDGFRLEVDLERPGSGFGLGIVKTIAELNMGSVTLEPAEIGGACFVVRIPVRSTSTLA